MTGEGNGRPRRYRVSLSGNVAKQIKELGQLAAQTGRLQAFTEALLAIRHRLRTDPFGFGEFTKRLPQSGTVFHVGGIPPLTVRIAIQEQQRVVLIIKAFLHPS